MRICVASRPCVQGAVWERKGRRERVSYASTSTYDFSGAPWNAHGSWNGAYLRADLRLFSPLSHGSRPSLTPRGARPRNSSSAEFTSTSAAISASFRPRPSHPSRVTSRDTCTSRHYFARTFVRVAKSELWGSLAERRGYHILRANSRSRLGWQPVGAIRCDKRGWTNATKA